MLRNALRGAAIRTDAALGAWLKPLQKWFEEAPKFARKYSETAAEKRSAGISENARQSSGVPKNISRRVETLLERPETVGGPETWL